MLNQGADSWKILRQCKKAIVNHSDAFEKFASRLEIIIEKILQEIEWIMENLLLLINCNKVFILTSQTTFSIFD